MAEGYQRVKVAKRPTDLTFIKEGCKLTRDGYYDNSCSVKFIADIYKPSGGGTGNTYVVSLMANPNWIKDYTTVARKMADRHPELSLYLPPHKESGVMVGPRLYKNGETTPL